MNYRALALGALTGFLFALSPACPGTTDPNKNCAESCDGCCDAKGQCLSAAQQNNNFCGVEGATCAACGQGETCDQGTCSVAPPTDGGNGNKTPFQLCQEANASKSGCCTPEGVWRQGTSGAFCGSGNGACAACDDASGEKCLTADTGRVCINPDELPHVGMACTADADCAGVAEGAFCKKETSLSKTAYPGGYCTIDCSENENICPSGSTCMGINSVFGEGDQFCFETTCDSTKNTGCRTGYRCYDFGSDTEALDACWLATPPNPRVAPAGFPGAACETVADCGENQPFDAQCIPAVFEDGSESFMPGGFCLNGCRVGSQVCGTNGVCVWDFLSAGNGQPFPGCFEKCSTPGGGQLECREGYNCQVYGTINADGTALVQGPGGACQPRCDAPTMGCGAGEQCNSEGYCEAIPAADAGQ